MASGYSATLPDDILLDTGVVYVGSTIWGATVGGVKFTPTEERRTVAFDGARSDVAGLERVTKYGGKFSATFIEFGTAQIPLMTGLAGTGGPLPLAMTFPTSRASSLIPLSATLADVYVVFQRRSGGLAKIHFPRAKVSVWSIEGHENAEALMAIEIDALAYPGNLGADEDTAPYRILLTGAATSSIDALFSLDWRMVTDRFTPRILIDRKNGPLDDMAMAGFIRDAATWGITHVRQTTPWQSALTIANDGKFYNAAGVVEDSRYRTKTDATVVLAAQVNTPAWQGVKTHPSQRFYFEVDCIIPAGYDAATIGQGWRMTIFQGTDPNANVNPFLDPLDPTFVKWQGSLALAARAGGWVKFRTAEVPVSTYTGADDVGGGQTNLYFVIFGPAGYSGGTLGIETRDPLICGGRIAALNPLDNGQHAPMEDSIGNWYCNPSLNCFKRSDDFTHATWVKTGVTVTPGQGNCPDFADTGSQWSRLAFTSGGTLAQVTQMERSGVVGLTFVPDYVWVHLPMKQDGGNALPADGDIIADLIGTVGTTSADMARQTIDGHIFYRARVPYKATNAGETNVTPTVRYRAKAGTTPQFLAVRAGVEPEKADASDRDIGTFDMVVPMYTTTTASRQAQTMARIVRGSDMINRHNGFYRGRVALPYNPLLLPIGSDKRLGYQGPAASVAGFDPKLLNQAGVPRYSCSLLDGVGGHSSDLFQVDLVAGFFDTVTKPGMWIFDWLVRWTADHFDAYWFNGVKGIPVYTPTAGTSWEMPGGPLWGPIDCDNVCGSDCFEQIRQTGLVSPSDADCALIVATR